MDGMRSSDTRVMRAERPEGFASSSWLGPPLHSLLGRQFDEACARLVALVEADFPVSLMVGIRTGGLVVAETMARFAQSSVPVLPLTSQRATTATKSRLPMLRTILGALPRPVLDMMRRIEHRYVTGSRAQQGRRQEINQSEAAAVAGHITQLAPPRRILVVDDAVDSGVTLATVLRVLHGVCPPRTEIRSAAITQTLENPAVHPDYVLYRGALCRFPWSFDAHG